MYYSFLSLFWYLRNSFVIKIRRARGWFVQTFSVRWRNCVRISWDLHIFSEGLFSTYVKFHLFNVDFTGSSQKD
jgi:hypothetical protein